MTKIDENIQTAQNLLSGIVERCYELEEENKKLKEEVKYRKEKTDFLNKVIVKYQEENKELKEEIKELRKNGEYYHRDNCQLRDEIMECKEVNGKLNEELKNAECEFGFACEEIDYRKREAKRLGWKARD